MSVPSFVPIHQVDHRIGESFDLLAVLEEKSEDQQSC